MIFYVYLLYSYETLNLHKLQKIPIAMLKIG